MRPRARRLQPALGRRGPRALAAGTPGPQARRDEPPWAVQDVPQPTHGERAELREAGVSRYRTPAGYAGAVPDPRGGQFLASVAKIQHVGSVAHAAANCEEGPATGRCRRCGADVVRRGRRGPFPLYCSTECRRAGDHEHRHERHELTCQRCRRPFRASDRGRRYCSDACARSARRTLGVRRCAICHAPFRPSRRAAACCSARCRSIKAGRTLRARAGQPITRTCGHCRAEFTPKERRRLTYCSRACAFAGRVFAGVTKADERARPMRSRPRRSQSTTREDERDDDEDDGETA